MDNTAGGLLCKRMQDVDHDLGRCTDLRVKMAEMAGTPLGLLLTSNNPWGQTDCLREDCVTCGQGGERLVDCKRRNILYESRCTLCNVEEGEKKAKTEDEISFLRAGKGIYVGESSRSLYERSK